MQLARFGRIGIKGKGLYKLIVITFILAVACCVVLFIFPNVITDYRKLLAQEALSLAERNLELAVKMRPYLEEERTDGLIMADIIKRALARQRHNTEVKKLLAELENDLTHLNSLIERIESPGSYLMSIGKIRNSKSIINCFRWRNKMAKDNKELEKIYRKEFPHWFDEEMFKEGKIKT